MSPRDPAPGGETLPRRRGSRSGGTLGRNLRQGHANHRADRAANGKLVHDVDSADRSAVERNPEGDAVGLAQPGRVIAVVVVALVERGEATEPAELDQPAARRAGVEKIGGVAPTNLVTVG